MTRPALTRRLGAGIVLAAMVCSGVALAVDDPSEMLPNTAQEHRAEMIGARLRCLVCQNESIEDSSASLARDLRRVVREQVAAGKSDRQIMDWMTARYGEFIRLAPEFSPATALLWLMPGLAVLGGFVIAWRMALRRGPSPGPLTDEERSRLEALAGRE